MQSNFSLTTELNRLWSNQLLRFLVVGAGNTAFGFVAYVFFLWTGLPYQIAVTFSTITGLIFNFFTTGGIVFKNRAAGRLIPFLAVYGITLLVNLILLTLLVSLGASKIYGQAAVLPIFILLSYLLNRHWVFRSR